MNWQLPTCHLCGALGQKVRVQNSREGDQPLSPKAEKLGYCFLQPQASSSLPLSFPVTASICLISRALPPLFAPTSLFQLVLFCFACRMPHLPKGICSTQSLSFFLRSFSLQASSQLHSIMSPLPTLATKQGPFLILPTFFPQILGLAVLAQLLSPHSTSLSHTYLPISELGQGCLYCQIQALYSIPYRRFFPWCSFQNGFLLFAILIYSFPS